MTYADQEDVVPSLLRKIKVLEADNAKLRAALELIASRNIVKTSSDIDISNWAIKRARAALETTNE